MYKDLSIEEFLDDLENKNVEMGGGSIIGLNLSSVCSLIIYIVNLTIVKEKYKRYEKQLIEVLKSATSLKEESLEIIDKDKEILEKILISYKQRNENLTGYQEACKNAVDFGFEVLENCMKAMELTRTISQIGNIMMTSDFEICAYNAYAAVESSITNININLASIEDENYVEKIKNKFLRLLDEAYDMKEEILKISRDRLK